MYKAGNKNNHLIPVLITATLSAAIVPWSTASAVETLFDVSAGPRIDELHWSFSGEPVGPNILSEVIWRSVDSVQIGADFRATTDGGFVLDAGIALGKIYDGRVEDSDYAGDNRTAIFSRSESETVDDDVIDISLAVGRAFPVTDAERTAITPMFGVSYHEQDFRVSRGDRLISGAAATTVPVVDIAGASYQAEWWSTFLGLQIEHRGSQWDTWGRVEYHNVDYEASANLDATTNPAQPDRIKQKSDGSGPVYEIGARYRYSRNLAFSARFTWSNWDTDSGTHRSIFADGRVADTELNTAQWERNAVLLGVTFISE